MLSVEILLLHLNHNIYILCHSLPARPCSVWLWAEWEWNFLYWCHSALLMRLCMPLIFPAIAVYQQCHPSIVRWLLLTYSSNGILLFYLYFCLFLCTRWQSPNYICSEIWLLMSSNSGNNVVSFVRNYLRSSQKNQIKLASKRPVIKSFPIVAEAKVDSCAASSLNCWHWVALWFHWNFLIDWDVPFSLGNP